MRFAVFPLLSFLWIHGLVGEVVTHRWSGSLNVPDPVACTVDEFGRVYVASTTRRKAADLDIREHPMWIADDVGLTTVEEKRAFLQRELAPGKLRLPRGGLKDHNKDGSIDWKDLTVHTERIYQLRDTDGDGTADKMTVFAEGFNTEVTGIAAGILYHDGWVYVTCAPDLWRLKDTDDDGVADVREVVAHGFGIHIAYAGHDMHGPRLGPDGRIYWSIGDKGVSVTSKEGKKFHLPHEGAVLRVEPDGAGFEIFARGLRNVQEIAFDDFGNMFGVDNDADMPGERERLVYITDQSDSGWRCGHQYMKMDSRWMQEEIWMPQQPWKGGASKQPLFITPPLSNYSDGPAGFAHEPGTALGTELRGHFILNQFPSGKMDAFTLEADGAAFRMKGLRTIHSGIMGIGMDWGLDGRLYFADWEGGYPLDEKGAIWTLDEPETQRDKAARLSTMETLARGFSKNTEAELQDLLGHADRRVRMGAQLELAKREQWDVLLAVAADEKAPLLARVHAIWGAGIGLRRGQLPEEHIHDRLLAEAEPELQAQLAKIIGDAKPSVAATRVLDRLLTSGHPRVRFHAALALGRLSPVSAGLTLAKVELNKAAYYMLERVEKDAADPFLRHSLVSGLAGCMSAEDLAAKSTDPSEAVRLTSALALARQRSPQITAFLEDTSDAVFDEVCRAIHDDIGIPEALPKLAALLDDDRPLTTAARKRIINANLRIGQPANASRLLQYALQQPPAHATQALAALLIYSKPPKLNLVDGTAGSYPRMDENALSPNLVDTWKSELLALKDPESKAAAIELLIQLELDVASQVLADIAIDEKAQLSLRKGALRLLAAKHSKTETFAKTLEKCRAKTAPEELRMESLSLAVKHQPDEALSAITAVLENGSLREKQAAFAHLAQLPGKPADQLTEAWLQKLADETVETSLRLDVIEAAQARESLSARLAAWQQTRKSAPALDLLEGGDISRGREVANNHIGANCIACHTIEAKEGSQVGPVLRTIGTQRERSHILDSLLNPQAEIAEGYGLVSITLKDGTSHAGALAKDDGKEVVLKLADGSQKKLAHETIASQTPPVSVMPPMLGILTPREIRDTVAYLASLQSGGAKKTDAAKSTPIVKTTEPNKKSPAPPKTPAKPPAQKAAPKVTQTKPKSPPPAPQSSVSDPPSPAPSAPSELPMDLSSVPKAIPLEEPDPEMPPDSPEASRKGLFNLRFGNRKKEAPTSTPPPAETAPTMPESPPTSADTPPTGEAAAKPASAPATKQADTSPPAPAKDATQTAAPSKTTPEPTPPASDMPVEAKSEEKAKSGFFSRFRSKKEEEE